jgi:hypothetical protein
VKHHAKCPKCGETYDATDLNKAGEEMWAKFGPPMCLAGCRVRMVEQITITQLGPGTRTRGGPSHG